MKAKHGFALIDLQHTCRVDTFKVVFGAGKALSMQEPQENGPPVEKMMLQGHDGAVKGPRDPFANPIVWKPMSTGQGPFHDELRAAFGTAKTDLAAGRDAVLSTIRSWVWDGTGGEGIHKECKYETGPMADQPLKSASKNFQQECSTAVTNAFGAAIAKVR